MADLKISVLNNMVNFQQTGDVRPYGRAKIEPRYTDTTVSFVHDDEDYLKFDTLQEQFLFSEIKDGAGASLPSVGTIKEDVQDYLSDKVGNFKAAGGGTALSTTTDTTNFNNNLSAADTDVQKALDTLDDLIASALNPNVLNKTFLDSGFVAANRNTVVVNTTGGNTTIFLPVAASSTNFQIKVKKEDGSVNKVIVDGNGAELIDGLTTYELILVHQSVNFECNGTRWYIF